jgi:hypothetical protein
MSESTLREIQDGTARQVAAWASLHADLRHVIGAVRALEIQQRQSTSDPTLKRSLWASALVTYMRCFSAGSAVKLDAAMFDAAPGGLAQAHRFLLDKANRQLAQPLNPFLHVQVGVELNAQGRPSGIGRIPLAPDVATQDMKNLASFAAEALKLVEKKEEELISLLQGQLQAMSTEALGALPRMSAKAGGGPT